MEAVRHAAREPWLRRPLREGAELDRPDVGDSYRDGGLLPERHPPHPDREGDGDENDDCDGGEPKGPSCVLSGAEAPKGPERSVYVLRLRLKGATTVRQELRSIVSEERQCQT